MARRPYLFCRYVFLVNDETLSAAAQLTALKELQGQFFARGPTAEREGRFDTVIMRPRSMTVDGEKVIAWSVGQRTDLRVGYTYDDQADRLEFVSIDDGTIRYNDFVAVPRLGVMAVDARTTDSHIGARGALARLRSSFRNLDGGDLVVEMASTSADFNRALQNWDLREVAFKVRPYNPHPPSELAKSLSEAMRKDGIGSLRAVAKSQTGTEMRPNEGLIDQAKSLVDDGYGQMGVRGVMSGHVATIKRPAFEEERSRNQSIQARPRELKVYVETDGDSDSESFSATAKVLRDFYDR